MKLAWKIAKRYFVARKSHHIINIISLVSVIGVAVGTMGLIIVLSVFNGFGDLVLSLYNSFNPDIRITPVKGKTFDPDSSAFPLITAMKEVKAVTFTLEENALLRYRERQYIATVKGVSDAFTETSDLQSKIIDGSALLKEGERDFLIAGGHIAWSLGMRPDDPLHTVGVYMPRKEIDAGTAMLDPSSAFSSRTIATSGVFSVQQDFDSKYVIVPLRFMRELTGTDKNITSMEIAAVPGTDLKILTEKIRAATGNRYEVKDRAMQNDFLYKILKSEKLAVYLILGFILLIAAFNVFGTLTMLILDKRDDIRVLGNLGADSGLIRRVFLLEGLLISIGGALIGMITGALICGIQQYTGVIKLEQAEGFLVDAYPVRMYVPDFLIVFGIVFIIGFTASWFTSRHIVTRQMQSQII